VTEILSAANVEEFKSGLSAIDIHVPARNEGREKYQTERYSIAHLLASLPSEELFFPLLLNHQERPDFVLTMVNRKIGIEHIEAVPENHVRASIFRKQGEGPQVHLLQRHIPGESRRSNNAILSEITHDRAGAPWVGNDVEVEWAEVMLHCIKGKVKKLNKPGFSKFEENWLLIYKNWPLPGIRHKEASSLLSNSCVADGLLDEFSRIFVLDSKVLCEISESTRLHTVKTPSVGV
jgi:hypothetical protein